MASKGVIVTWGRNISGREQMGLGVFMAALEHYGKLKATGEIEDYRVYINRQGNLSASSGLMTVDGSAEQIQKLLDSDMFQELLTKAHHVVDGLSVVHADTGDSIPKRVEQLQAARKQLGI